MTQGKLIVIGGPMFAGKTTELVKHVHRVRRKDPQSILVVQPTLNKRYGGKLVSHKQAAQGEQSGIDAIGVEIENPDILALTNPLTRWVAIDETNFFPKDTLVYEIALLLQAGINVVAVGLVYDCKKKIFGATKALMDMASPENVTYLEARCYLCDGPARHTKQLIPFKRKGQIRVGGSEEYQPCCDMCWRKRKLKNDRQPS